MGAVLTGKVTGITKFGAFVTIAPGKSGLVHISEIANTYVNDVNEHLSDGQEVTVKIIGIDANGRLNMSIKAALPPAPEHQRPQRQGFQPQRQGGFQQQRQGGFQPPRRAPSAGFSQTPKEATVGPGDPTFEDKLKRFMQDSDSKMSGLKQYSDKRGGRKRGR